MLELSYATYMLHNQAYKIYLGPTPLTEKSKSTNITPLQGPIMKRKKLYNSKLARQKITLLHLGVRMAFRMNLRFTLCNLRTYSSKKKESKESKMLETKVDVDYQKKERKVL
jgi:hypothetical protein